MSNIQTVYLGDHQCNDFYSMQPPSDSMRPAGERDMASSAPYPDNQLLDLLFGTAELEELFFSGE